MMVELQKKALLQLQHIWLSVARSYSVWWYRVPDSVSPVPFTESEAAYVHRVEAAPAERALVWLMDSACELIVDDLCPISQAQSFPASQVADQVLPVLVQLRWAPEGLVSQRIL